MMLRPLVLALVLLAPAAPPLRAETVVPALLPFPAPAAARQISVTVDRGLTRTAKLPTEALRKARRDLHAGHELPDADLRALADRRDGLAAQAYVRRLAKVAAPDAATRSDIAYYASIAVASGRVWTLPEAVAAMLSLDPATEPKERVRTYMAMLYPHAWAGNALAQDALIALNGEGRLFGPMSAKTRNRLLETGRRAGDGRVALQLAMAALREVPADTAFARSRLTEAQDSVHLAIRTTAAALLAGLDGAAPPQVTQ
jgi:hypothetical protein